MAKSTETGFAATVREAFDDSLSPNEGWQILFGKVAEVLGEDRPEIETMFWQAAKLAASEREHKAAFRTEAPE